jgi:hypothetical protein
MAEFLMRMESMISGTSRSWTLRRLWEKTVCQQATQQMTTGSPFCRKHAALLRRSHCTGSSASPTALAAELPTLVRWITLSSGECAIGQKRSLPLAQICLRLDGPLLRDQFARLSLGPRASALSRALVGLLLEGTHRASRPEQLALIYLDQTKRSRCRAAVAARLFGSDTSLNRARSSGSDGRKPRQGLRRRRRGHSTAGNPLSSSRETRTAGIELDLPRPLR